MDFYVPPIFTVILGLLVVGGIFIARVPIIVVAVISIGLLAYTFYLHTALYGIDYRSMSLGEGIKSAAPFLLIGAVLVMSIGYVLMLRKGTPTTGSSTGYYNGSASRGFFSSLMPTTTSYFSASPNRPSTGNYTSSERREYVSALNRLV